MVAKPTFSDAMEREGRRNARLHPEERRKVLEACDKAAGGRIDRRCAEVLIWDNAAFVKPYTFWIDKNDQGEWEALRVNF